MAIGDDSTPERQKTRPERQSGLYAAPYQLRFIPISQTAMRPNFYAALTEKPPAPKKYPDNIEDFVQKQVRRQILFYCGHLRWIDWALLEILNGDSFLPRERIFAERTKTIDRLFQELERLAPGFHEEKLKKAWFDDTVIYGSIGNLPSDKVRAMFSYL